MGKIYNYKFVLVEATYLNNERYWALFIENIKDLFYYFEQSSPKLMKAYFDIKKKSYRRYHCSNVEQSVIETLFVTNNENRKTFIDDINHISDKIQGTKIKFVLDGHKLLINQTGIGFCPYNKKHHTIIKTIKKKDYNFPTHTLTEKDIKITKWEKGKHWYVRIGQHDLEGKFNTYKYAEEQAHKFLRKLKKGTGFK